MNRLRRHKKDKANRHDILPSEKPSTTTIISSFSPSKKGKNNNNNNSNDNTTTSTLNDKKDDEPTPKVSDFDLANALPPPEDFRTSLLMPKLSARFSMLKEQDDPESLLGKASDDSVLFPKRASHLNVFGHNPSLLSDIEEMSIDGRIMDRTDSFASGGSNGTDDDRSQNGSSMSRARRTEGNNLFGGRQKVFKIPARSRGASPKPEGRTGLGKPVYEHDMTLSPFQRMRMKEKEDRAVEDPTSPTIPEYNAPESHEDALSSAASTHRTTYCSTASGPPPTIGRASTAATSIDEQPPTPQSLAPSTASEGQAGKPPLPAMHAERGSARARRLYGQGLAQSVQSQQHSTLNRLENLSRQRPGTPELPSRAYSRSATSLRDRLQNLPLVEPPSRPTSPPLSSASPRPQPVENEPREPVPAAYGVPPLSPPISEVEEQQPQGLVAALQPEDHGKATALGLFNKPRAPFDEKQFTRRQLQMHEGRNTPPLRRLPSPPRNPPTNVLHDRVGRARGFSNTSSHRSRAGSASSQYGEAQRGGATFFANSSASESGDEEEPDEGDIHPAFRSRTPSRPSTPNKEQERHPLPEVRFSDLGDLKPIAENDIAENAGSQETDAAPQEPDSPTLGPSGLGLSGLVRTHLRKGSDRSSVQLPSPGLTPKITDNGDIPVVGPQSEAAANDPSPASTVSAQSESDHDHESQGQSEPAKGEPRTSNESSLDEELQHGHRRTASTETQREREEFANELAERRRRVQEKLQGFADSESRSGSRSGSPVPGRQTPDAGPKPGNAFAMLRNRTGKHHLFQKPLGFGNSSTPSLVLDQQDPWREEDERVPFPGLGNNHMNSSTPDVVPEPPSVRSRVAAIARSQEGSRESSRSRGASPHSITGLRSRRARSRSDASGRSKSRSRLDELGTVDEASVVSHETIQLPDTTYDPYANTSVASSNRPSMDVSESGSGAYYHHRSSSVTSGRYRSSSRSGTPNYFDLPPPPGPNPVMIGNPPRPSPIAPPYSANATPPLYEISPDPTSPPAPTFAAAAGHVVVPQRAPGHTGLQKRTVNKVQISEPTLVSCTSNVPTVGLPAGASLTNGMDTTTTPPVPPMNPRRRRQTTTQTFLGAFKHNKHDAEQQQHHQHQGSSGRGSPVGRDTPDEHERSVFKHEIEKPRPLSRSRLRKISSEGGSLNVKARQEVYAAGPPPPPLPPPAYPPPNVPMDGGMF